MNEKQLTVDLWQRFVYAQTPMFHYYFVSSFPISFPPAALDSASSKWKRVFLSIINRLSPTSGITFWQLSAILMLMTTNTAIYFLCLSHLHNLVKYVSIFLTDSFFSPLTIHWIATIDKMVTPDPIVTVSVWDNCTMSSWSTTAASLCGSWQEGSDFQKKNVSTAHSHFLASRQLLYLGFSTVKLENLFSIFSADV